MFRLLPTPCCTTEEKNVNQYSAKGYHSDLRKSKELNANATPFSSFRKPHMSV